jgi:hypothetical protein
LSRLGAATVTILVSSSLGAISDAPEGSTDVDSVGDQVTDVLSSREIKQQLGMAVEQAPSRLAKKSCARNGSSSTRSRQRIVPTAPAVLPASSSMA